MEGKTMRRIIYSVCIGSLALALTAGAQQVNDRKSQRAKPQARTANVHAARPANTGAMIGARHYNSTAQYRQRSYVTPRARSNAVASQNQNARMRASNERNRDQEFRARNNVAVNRERNVAVNRTTKMDRNRNANAF